VRSGWLLLSLGIAILASCGFAQGTVTVPDDYPTIQAAIDAAQPGDTVFIREGKYKENLIITKPLNLIGEEHSLVKIQPADQEAPIIHVDLEGGGVFINELTIQNGKIGILIRVNLRGRVVINCVNVVKNYIQGIFANGSGSVTIQQSVLLNNGGGVYAGAADMKLYGVEIIGGMVGILFAGGGWKHMEGCLVGLPFHAVEAFAQDCGWTIAPRYFVGRITGSANRVCGLESDLCPNYPGNLWPNGFLNEEWRRLVRKALIFFEEGEKAYETQRYKASAEALEQALTQLKEARFPFLEADVCHNLAAVYRELGRYAEALLKCAEARAIYVEYGAWTEVADVDANTGTIYGSLGRYEEALWRFNAAREAYLEQEMWVDVAAMEGNIGHIYAELGRYEEALQKYEAARKVFVEQEMWVDVAKVDMNMANAYKNLGLYEEALQKYEAARKVFVEQEMWVDVAKVDTNMGNTFRNLNKYDKALSKLEIAWEVFMRQEMWSSVAFVSTSIGTVYAELGRYEDALAKFEESLSFLDRISPLPTMDYSYPSERWRIHFYSAWVYEMMQRFDEAVISYQKAIAVIESIRGHLRTEKLKRAWEEKTRDVYERLIDLLYRLGQGALAFPYAERCRARTFLDVLYQGGIKPEQFIGPEEGVVAGAVDPAAIEAAIERALSLLGPDEAVFSYFVTGKGVYLWVITQEGVGDPIFIPYPRDELMGDIVSARRRLEGRDPTVVEDALAGFYERLVKPGLELLEAGVKTLAIIPSGPLWYLPFAALPMTDRPRISMGLTQRSPYLVEGYTLAYLPSLASLAAVEERGGGAEAPFLGLANPVTVVEGPCAEAERYAELEEATESFARTYAGGEGEVYTGKGAEEGLAYRRASGHRVVVYACHGQFNPYVPLQSKLLLAPGGEDVAEGDPRVPDGDYHAWEVLLTPHEGVELVVLAACETLLPSFRNLQGQLAVLSGKECKEAGEQELSEKQLEEITTGDEVVGLVRAFLSGGARSVLATLWQANPTAVEELLVRMAEHRGEGLSWAEALAQAQRDLLEMDSFSHPWFWAPYQLVGR